MRFGGSDDDDEEEDDEADTDTVPESDPEEDDPEEAPVEEEPAGYTDDMGTTTDDIIESLTTRTTELEERVQHLEEQNAVHQYMEDQYRDVAHQRQGQATELRQAQRVLIRQLEQQVTRADQLQTERDAARAELLAVRGELALEADILDFVQEAWVRATARVTELEEQVRGEVARTDAALFAFDTAMGRLRSRIRRFPRDEDMSRRVISHRVADHMIY